MNFKSSEDVIYDDRRKDSSDIIDHAASELADTNKGLSGKK